VRFVSQHIMTYLNDNQTKPICVKCSRLFHRIAVTLYRLSMTAGDAGRPPSSRSSVPNAMLGDASAMPTGLPGSADTLLKGLNFAGLPNGPVAPNFNTMLPEVGAPLTNYHQLAPSVSDASGTEQSKNGRRPLVGQGLMFHGIPSTGIDFGQQQQANGPSAVLNHPMAAQAGRPIIKGEAV